MSTRHIFILREDLRVDDLSSENPPTGVILLATDALPSFFAKSRVGISSASITYYALSDYAANGTKHTPNDFTFIDYEDVSIVNGPIYAIVTNDDSSCTQLNLAKKYFESVATSLKFMEDVPILTEDITHVCGFSYSIDIHLVNIITTAKLTSAVKFIDGRLLFSAVDRIYADRFVETMRQISLLDKDLVFTVCHLFAFLMSRGTTLNSASLDAFTVLGKDHISNKTKTRLKILLQYCLDTKSPNPPSFLPLATVSTSGTGVFFNSHPPAIQSIGSLMLKY